MSTVHPRVRGDGLVPNELSSAWTGSPPRARGRVSEPERAHFENRFTPACAGTGAMVRRLADRLQVHPRVRGDGEGAATFGVLGHRFTPACAGTGLTFGLELLLKPVHPRVRGDGASIEASVGGNTGSPPRARGRERRAAP